MGFEIKPAERAGIAQSPSARTPASHLHLYRRRRLRSGARSGSRWPDHPGVAGQAVQRQYSRSDDSGNGCYWNLKWVSACRRHQRGDLMHGETMLKGQPLWYKGLTHATHRQHSYTDGSGIGCYWNVKWVSACRRHQRDDSMHGDTVLKGRPFWYEGLTHAAQRQHGHADDSGAGCYWSLKWISACRRHQRDDSMHGDTVLKGQPFWYEGLTYAEFVWDGCKFLFSACRRHSVRWRCSYSLADFYSLQSSIPGCCYQAPGGHECWQDLETCHYEWQISIVRRSWHCWTFTMRTPDAWDCWGFVQFSACRRHSHSTLQDGHAQGRFTELTGWQLELSLLDLGDGECPRLQRTDQMLPDSICDWKPLSS